VWCGRMRKNKKSSCVPRHFGVYYIGWILDKKGRA